MYNNNISYGTEFLTEDLPDHRWWQSQSMFDSAQSGHSIQYPNNVTLTLDLRKVSPGKRSGIRRMSMFDPKLRPLPNITLKRK